MIMQSRTSYSIFEVLYKRLRKTCCIGLLVQLGLRKRILAMGFVVCFLTSLIIWMDDMVAGYATYSHAFHPDPAVSWMNMSSRLSAGRGLGERQHFYQDRVSALRLRARDHNSGLPITTSAYNSSYMSPCWGHPGRFFCLPYFFLAGFPKCGTTELYSLLTLHPHIVKAAGKEPHWWTRKRFLAASSGGIYLENFKAASRSIEQHPDYITLDGSASTLWDNGELFPHFGNASSEDPHLLTAHYIHRQLPNSKYVVIVRDPVTRLYSDYLWFDRDYKKPRSARGNDTTKSPVDFHARVEDAVKRFNACMRDPNLSHLHCVYAKLATADFLRRLRIGLYFYHISSWLSVFSADNVLVVRLEDLAHNRIVLLQNIYDFLGVRRLSLAQVEGLVASRSHIANSNVRAYNATGPMLPHTQHLLEQFYKPSNERLARLLGDARFLFNRKE